MQDSTEYVTVQIVELLRNKKKYVQNLRQLALKQGEAIKNKNREALSDLLGAREAVMGEIDRLNGELAARRKDPPGESPRMAGGPVETPVEDGETGKLTEEIGILLRETQSIDTQNARLAVGLREEARDHLKSVSLHKKSRAVYGGKGKEFVGGFLNRKS